MASELGDTIREDLILLDLPVGSIEEAIRQMVDLLVARGLLTEPDDFLREVMKREQIEATGYGRGVAFPHGRTRYLEKPAIVIARLAHPIRYPSIDEEPVQLLFLFGTPEEEAELYLRLLSQLCTLLRQHSIREDLFKARSPKEIKNILVSGIEEDSCPTG